jgi:hypothetical protein
MKDQVCLKLDPVPLRNGRAAQVLQRLITRLESTILEQTGPLQLWLQLQRMRLACKPRLPETVTQRELPLLDQPNGRTRP